MEAANNSNTITVAPSLISLDDCNMAGLAKNLEAGGFDTLHVDIIDGYFSPSMPLGVDATVKLSKLTNLKFDIHLMANENQFFVDELLKSNPYQLCFHLETEPHPDRMLTYIKSHGVRAGLALKPSTPLHELEYLLERCDFVLIMLINPGYAQVPGESKVPYGPRKVQALYEMIRQRGLSTRIDLDGRISLEDVMNYSKLGARSFVCGSTCFQADKSLAENAVNILDVAKKAEAQLG